MNSFKMVKLGDVCDILRGVTFSKSESSDTPTMNSLPIIRAGNIQEQLILDKNLVYVGSKKVSQIQLIKKNDIIICTSSGSLKIIGKCRIAKKDWNGSYGAFNACIRTKNGTHSSYVYYYLLSNKFRKWCELSLGANIKNIRNSELKKFQIPLPPLPVQKKIIALLDRAQELIDDRKEQIRLMDALIQSVFYDMFGDPVTNPKGWEVKKLEDVGNWKSGGTPLRKITEYYQGSIPWVSSGELNYTYIYDSNEYITLEAVNHSATKVMPEGSLMLGMYDTAALKSSIAQREMTCNQAIVFSRLDDLLCNTIFIYWCIQIGKDHYKRMQRGVRQKNMNLNMIKKLKVIIPDISVQNQFAERVERIEAQKELMQQSLTLIREAKAC